MKNHLIVIFNPQIGPWQLPPRLNGQMYTEFLRDDLPGLLEDVPLGRRIQAWYQHDGAPPHYSRAARDQLDISYPGRWIGRNGPVTWPPRSPDLNPLDYFFWGHIKEQVHFDEVHSLEILNERITAACRSIQRPMIRRAIASLIRRAELCLEMEGGLFEHLL